MKPKITRLVSFFKQSKYQWYDSFIALLLGVVLSILPLPAHANVFDPILKVLLPFYDWKTPDQSKQSSQKDERVPSEQPDVLLKQESNEVVFTDEVNIQEESEAGNTDDILDSTDEEEGLENASDYYAKAEPSLYALLEAEFSWDRGNSEKGLQIYKEQAFGKDATAVFERALTLSLEHEEPEASLAFASAWYKQNPDHIPAWFYVAHLALQAHDYQLAGETLGHILDYDPKADLSDILEGIYPEDEADQRALLTTLQQLNSKENPTLSILQAGLLLQQNQPKIALIHAERALKFEPNHVPYITLKADILKQLVEPKEVIKLMSRARKRLPDEKKLYLYEVRYRLNEIDKSIAQSSMDALTDEEKTKANKAKKENNDKALALLLKAVNQFPEDPEISLLAALVSLDAEKYELGDELLTDLLDRPAYFDRANFYLGISAERQHRYYDAGMYFAKVMQEDLVLQVRKKVVGYALLAGDVDMAIETLEKMRLDFPIYAPDSYILHADILKQENKVNEAKILLEKARTAFPKDKSIEFAFVQLLDDIRDYEQKYQLLTHLQNEDPENLQYQLYFSKLLLTHNPNSVQGKQVAESIVNISYDDPRFDTDQYIQGLNILSSAELAKQNYQQVIEYLQTPFEVMPELKTGKLLLQAYQGLKLESQANDLIQQLEDKFGYQQPENELQEKPTLDKILKSTTNQDDSSQDVNSGQLTLTDDVDMKSITPNQSSHQPNTQQVTVPNSQPNHQHKPKNFVDISQKDSPNQGLNPRLQPMKYQPPKSQTSNFRPPNRLLR